MLFLEGENPSATGKLTKVREDARITHVWDEKKEDAEESAEICGIENVVSNKEDMIGKVEGIIVADDCTMKHQKRAIPFLEAGIPTFIDKPLSPDIKEAEEIVALAKKHGAPMMSCSALRYAKETKEFREGKGHTDCGVQRWAQVCSICL